MHTCPVGHINCGGVSVRLYVYLWGGRLIELGFVRAVRDKIGREMRVKGSGEDSG